MITENTRNDHCIDNIFINFNITSCIATIESKFCSDHLGQKKIFQPPKTLPVSSAKIVCRPITEYGKFVFFNLVDKLNWDFIQDSSLNCDNKFELFIHKLQNCLHEAFPEKNLPCRPDMTYNSNWFHDELRGMREYLYFLNNLYKRSKSEYLKHTLNEFRKTYKHAIITAKKNYNEQIIRRSSNPTKAMWEIVNRARKSSSLSIDQNSKDPNEFNNFFCSVAEKLLEDFEKNNSNSYNSSVRSNMNFSFNKVSSNDVRDAINSLKIKPSKDIYGMSTLLVSNIKNLIIAPLTKLINICIDISRLLEACSCFFFSLSVIGACSCYSYF
nr:unnamed protein product [Callosobruchus analis]